jgi:phosphohistidine phosphatase SixA
VSTTSQIKYIFIVRHGHADFDASRDIDRQLNPKGIIASKNIATFIKQKCQQHNLVIDVCISSAAVRTKQTTEIISESNKINNCLYYQELYATNISTWLDKIAEQSAQNIIIVGHNPTLSQFLNNVCGYELYMQPANCAFIKLEILPDGIIYPATLIEYNHNE